MNLDRAAAKLIAHLQRHYGTTQAELLRRSLDYTHIRFYNHRPVVLHEYVAASTDEPMLVNFFLPMLLLDNTMYQARRLEISLPEYLRRAVIEYAVPAIRSMYSGDDACRASGTVVALK